MLDHELREIKSTVEKLTQEILELQEVLNSYSESQDVKDLETASSSGSAQALGKLSVFQSFFKPCQPRPVPPFYHTGLKKLARKRF